MSIDALLGSRDATEQVQALPLWRATIADTAATADDLVRVLIAGADNGQRLHGPASFMPRGALLPAAGDEALIAYDDEGDLWIIGWRSPT